MERFLNQYKDRIKGIISGFDRILFRGSLRSISHSNGIEAWLSSQNILMKDFGSYAMDISEQIKQHAQQYAQSLGRPYLYVYSPNASKEDIAREHH